MSLHNQYDAGKEEDDEEEEFSYSENDDGFNEDMEALKQACLRTGADLNELEITSATAAASVDDENRPSISDAAAISSSACSDSEDDLEIFRSIRSRFALSEDACEPLSLKPLCAILPSDDDAEDDFETLRVIQKRFSNYYSTCDTWGNSREDPILKAEPVYKTTMPLEDAKCNDICEDFRNFETAGNISRLSCQNAEIPPGDLDHLEQLDANELLTREDKSSRYPESARLLMDAIKKNRSYQKFLRSKLTKIEAKIEENKELKERVKILRDFQVSCKKITGRALSMKKDPRIQLISARKSRTSEDPETDAKRVSSDCGPPENSSVTNYRMALTKFPLSLQRKKWSKEERENLEKGIRQQFQERALQVSVDWFSADGSSEDLSNLDGIIATVKDLEITPERIREFLPNVNWDQLASMYVKGRSGAECETRWLNHEDPLINRNLWTAEEDKKLLLLVQEKGISNWFDIAVSLGSNRTPFQCLARYQRSLNACILKREWTEEEDDQLRLAVEAFGECDWQSVASTLKGRTGTQCSNRWKKSLHPTRQIVGRWKQDEDKRLKVAVMLFGPKNWKKISEVVPGRTQVQCRERWVNSLDPTLNLGVWTNEEDLRLEAAIKQHGYCWSKIAACVRTRTDNQCWRRWKTLHPKAVPLLQEARRIRKTSLISNFVDRESERPALGPNDFCSSLPMIASTSEPENTDQPSKGKRKERARRQERLKEDNAALRRCSGRSRHKGHRKGVQTCSVEVPGMINENGAEIASGRDANRKKQRNPNSGDNNCTEPAEDVAFTKKRKRKPPSGCNNNDKEPAQVVLIREKRIREPPSGHVNCSDKMLEDAVQNTKRKQQLETNKCIQPMKQGKTSSHQLSSLCMTTNYEAESFGSNLTIKKKNHSKLSPKHCSKRRAHTQSDEELNSVCSQNSMFSGARDGAEVIQDNGVEVDTAGVDDASSKKSTAKPGSKIKKCMNLSSSQNSRIGSAAASVKFSSNNLKKRKKASLRQHCRSREIDEPSQVKHDITLASFLKHKSEKKNPSLADDEMPLAFFLSNKSTKRRHQIVENADSPIPGVDQHRKAKRMRHGSQHCEAKRQCDRSRDSGIGGIDVENETVAPDEVAREPGRMINQEDDCEGDGIPLVSLFNRIKKRRDAIKVK